MTRTGETTADVDVFLREAAGDARLPDAEALVEMMQRVAGAPPRMWGPSIVGFGRYHYRYDSGHEGDSCLIGFSPRRSEFSIYLTGIYFDASKSRAEALLSRLGRHRIGKACLYVRRLSDIDLEVLDELCRLSVDELRAHYGDDGQQAATAPR